MKRFLFENFGLKVLALLIAVVLWAFVGSRQVMERKMNLRIEFNDIPPGTTLGSNVRTSLPVVLIGRKESVLDLVPEDLRAVVSLEGHPLGQKDMLVHPRVLNLPRGVTANVNDFTVPLVVQPDAKNASRKPAQHNGKR